MTAALVLLSPGDAQRLTQRIKLTASSVRDGMFKLRNLVEEAKRSNVWQVLGFPSWTAYLADTLADEPMRLGRDERQELVGYLAGEGLSTRAIAPIVGVSQKTIDRDVRESFDSPAPEPEVEADLVTGEVIEPGAAQVPDAVTAPVEATPTPPRAVTGLDGKTYPVKPTPKPAEDPALQNAEAMSKDVARSLMSLSGMQYPAHRNRVITEWWPAGKDAVPPDWVALFQPGPIRDIATWLWQLAEELEGRS